MSKKKRKKLIVNADSDQLEVVIGEIENEKVSLHFARSYSITFDSEDDWEAFVKYIVQLNPTKKIGSMLKPVLQAGDLIQWDDGAIGLVVSVFLDENMPDTMSRIKFFGERDQMLWLYSIKWNDRNEISVVTHEALLPRKFDKHTRWKLLSRVRSSDDE